MDKRGKVDDGGPIHPLPEVRGHDGCGLVEGWPGMSLRDWFAGQIEMPRDGISQTWAEALMGEKAPDWQLDSGLDCIRWWSAAEARARYLTADAMLAARTLLQEEGK
jgi:hypothetical protein